MSNNLFRDGCLWGIIRLLAIFLALLFFIQIGRLIFEQVDTRAAMAVWDDNNSLLQNLPAGIQRSIAFLFSGVFFRYFYFPIAAFIGAILLMARYVQETYHLPRFRQGLSYILAIIIGTGYPRLWIQDGRIRSDSQEINFLELKGGPGIVSVSPDSAILIENSERPVRVISRGLDFISQTELIKVANSLEDQHGFIETVPATTKDGIPIQVRDIHFRYRALRETEISGNQPHPRLDQAMREIAYKRIVSMDETSTWRSSVQFTVQSVITNYVAGSRIDDLTTAPANDDPNPRVKIRERLLETSRERFNQLGTELIWVDIGHFDILRKEERDPRPEKWGKKWEGISKTERAFGEKERLYHMELGRAEAQSEIISMIMQSLEDASISKDRRENLQRIILMRTAQVLEAMTEKKSKTETPPQTRRALMHPRRRRRR